MTEEHVNEIMQRLEAFADAWLIRQGLPPRHPDNPVINSMTQEMLQRHVGEREVPTPDNPDTRK